MEPSLTALLVRSFAASMPLAYRSAFDPAAVAQHAAIVRRRRPGACRVEAWREDAGRLTALCAIADHGPYLHAQVAAALASCELNVVAARSYSRTTVDGRRETIALQWVRPVPTTMRGASIESIGRTLDAFVSGRASVEDAIAFSRIAASTGVSTCVRFQRQDPKGLALSTEAGDRPALLLYVSEALARVRMQIVQSETYTSQGQMRDCLYLTELDGAKLATERLLEAQTAVLGAIERTHRVDGRARPARTAIANGAVTSVARRHRAHVP
jgi:UTP:GlnB (protein PII) uridylyltransferase